MEEKKKGWLARALVFAGAFFSANAGAGTASGQDTLQYFANFGVGKCILTLILMVVVFSIMNYIIIDFGYREKDYLEGVDTYDFYCGKYVGAVIKVLMPIFLLLCSLTMCSGAGAALTEKWGVSQVVGTGIVVVVMTICYLLGTRTLINILGGIGPIIIIFAAVVCLFSIFRGEGIGTADAYIASNEVLTSSKWWWMSAILFAVFGPLVMAKFLQQMGANEENGKSVSVGTILGSVFYCGIVAFIAFAELSNMSIVGSVGVPTLALANSISSTLGGIYSIIVVLAIYSTVAPLHWSLCKSLPVKNAKQEKICAVVAAVIILIGSQLPYAVLINILYPLMSYFGIIFFVFVVVRWLTWKKNKADA